MDRLPTVAIAVFAAIAATGCRDSDKLAVSMDRVNAVAASARKEVPLAELCDVHPDAAHAPAFRLPELAGRAAPGAPPIWRWVNVWATWCKPCVEEMPLLTRLKARLDRERLPVELVFLSVDESDEAVTSFREQHPATPATLRTRNVDSLEPWIVSLGLDPSAAIPIHVFADAKQKVRCVRSGPVAEEHYPTIARLVGGK